ncbi:MAG: hypothetical protein KIT33_11350 [Candidatus Kapabacteria bacterium]|nr:hypothetical protein [Ignavibacteriota bacterium]MCW5885554.1 hypothetical protein [Candidatus Kapabacteria bacterium]
MLKYSIILVLILSFFTSAGSFAQGRQGFKKERIDVAKKMRLLEILDLNENESDKFLAKFTILEKNVKDKSDEFKKANDDLVEYIEKNPKGKDLTEKSNAVLKAQRNLHAAVEAKISDMKQVLSEDNFAKYVAFEIQFARKMRKMILDREMPGADFNPEDDIPSPPRGRRNR